jgi:hypothetical protein
MEGPKLDWGRVDLTGLSDRWPKGEDGTPEALDHAACELTDIIVAATGVLDKMGVNEAMRRSYVRRINASNCQRDGGHRFAH